MNMIIRYIENRYTTTQDSMAIHDTAEDKYICVCQSYDIAQHITMLLNEEPLKDKFLNEIEHIIETVYP